MGDIRQKIRSVLFESNYTLNNPAEVEPHNNFVKVFSEDWGVLSFRFDKRNLDITDMLDRLKPYFDDIEVKYVNLDSEHGLISMNVQYQYKDLLIELMEIMGFQFDTETFGAENRSAATPRRSYSHAGLNIGSGIHGGYSLPVLIGEV